MMKIKFTLLLFLAVSMAFAQKKQMKELEKALQAKKYGEATTILKSIDENSVDENFKANFYYFKGETLIGDPAKSSATIDQIATAKESLRKAISLDIKLKENANILISNANNRLFLIARDLLKNEKGVEAAGLIDLIYEDDKTNLDMLYSAATLYYGAGEFEKAQDRFETLFDKNFTGVKTSYYAVEVATGEKRLFPNAKARDIGVLSKQYTKPTIEDSKSEVGDIVLNLVWLYKQSGDLQKAKDFFEKAKVKYPQDKSLKLKYSDIYLQLEMMDEYEKASLELTESVKDPKVYDNLAIAAQKTSNWDQVIKYYKSSLDLNIENYAANVNIANAYIQKGNAESTTAKEQEEFYKAAMGHLEKANSMKPDDESVRNTLIQIYKLFKMDDKASLLEKK